MGLSSQINTHRGAEPIMWSAVEGRAYPPELGPLRLVQQRCSTAVLTAAAAALADVLMQCCL
jgi:hypothetical protein